MRSLVILFSKFIIIFGIIGIAHAKVLDTLQTAVFAGGCFCCLEADFDKVSGVISTTSGFAGGSVVNPSYEQVSRGCTGHYESVKIVYDSKRINYQQLLTVFWHSIDPIDSGGQFCDRGQQYQSVIFYQNEQQKQFAFDSKEALLRSKKFNFIATKILPLNHFYPAEIYHQGYAHKNPIRYHYYRYRCGRDQRVQAIWGSK